MSNRRKIKKTKELVRRAIHVAKLNKAKDWDDALQVTQFELHLIKLMGTEQWRSVVLQELERQDVDASELALSLRVEVPDDPGRVPMS